MAWELDYGGWPLDRLKAEWRKRGPGAGWVEPDRPDNRTREESPYGYSAFYIWRARDLSGAEAVYDDRMRQWDAEKYRDACRKVPGKKFSQFTRTDCERFLSAYYGRPIKALALAEGRNVSNGYPYWIFWLLDAALPRKEGE